MPQEKFITRKQAGIYTRTGNDVSTPSSRAANKALDTEARMNKVAADVKAVSEVNSRASKAQRASGNLGPSKVTANRAPELTSKSGRENIARAANADVMARDATNARIARGRFASRASDVAAKAQPRGGGMLDKVGGRAAAMGPMAAVASAMYNADEATGFRRTKYSGNSGGPSFSMNPYASSNKSAYAGQSNVSKLMGVGKKK